MSSKVIGNRSGPGSTTRPTSLVPLTDNWPTVVNDTLAAPPATLLPSASRKAPSAAARICEPSTCTVMRAAPGIGLARNNQA